MKRVFDVKSAKEFVGKQDVTVILPDRKSVSDAVDELGVKNVTKTIGNQFGVEEWVEGSVNGFKVIVFNDFYR